ncbi:unnamed protein product, partial [Candida parapsilosis]
MGNSHTAAAKSVVDVPKSLQMLFEDPDEKKNDQSMLNPQLCSLQMTESILQPLKFPIWTPLSNYPSSASLLNNNQNVSTLTKPPTLHHTQSASGNLETRFNPINTSPTDSRPRKKTISNTMGGGGTSSILSPSG